MLPRHRLYTWTVLILLSSLAQCAPLSSDAKSGALAARSAPSTLSTALDTYYGGKSSSKGPSTINLSDIQVLQELHLDAAARYARAAYCAQVSEGATWTCGTACDATPGTEVIWTFGDNKRVPYVYIAYSPLLAAIVVAHAGSNFDSIHSWLTDFDIMPDVADTDLDDGRSTENKPAYIHSGFHEVWLETKKDVLKQVKAALKKRPQVKTVLCVGHSLGGAIAQLEAVYLRNMLSKSITVENITFGCPRVGNKRWANQVDRVLGTNQVRVVYDNDIVPRLPPGSLGFEHPSNEVWLDQEAKKVRLCRGQENQECSAGLSRFRTSRKAHSGPYFGVRIVGGLCAV